MIARLTLVLVTVVVSVVGMTGVGLAQRSGAFAPLVQSVPGGVTITWLPDALVDKDSPPVLVALRAVEGVDITPVIMRLDDRAAQPTDDILPATPVAVLREARSRGERIVVLALAPRYGLDGSPRVVRALVVFVPSTTAMDSHPESMAVAAAGSSAPATIPLPPPSFPPADALRVQVSHEGIQALTVSALGAAYATSLAGANIRVSRGGVEIPVELRDVDGGGWGGPADELRFYAPPPGDRWNLSDTYWIWLEQGTRLRITTRAVPAPSGGAPTTAIQHGLLHGIAYYDSRIPGGDGDHWFAAELQAEAGVPADDRATMTVPLTTTLPAVSGNVTFDVTVQTGLTDPRSLTAIGNLGAGAPVVWNGAGVTTQSLSAPVSAASDAQAQISLAAVSGLADIAVDTIGWRRPVQLAFGGNGAIFSGAAGQSAYQLSGAPAGYALYDITDPADPVRVQPANSASFEDSLTGRTYLLSGAGTRYTPTVAAYAATALPSRADVIYIAPSQFFTALTPLLDHRRAQGYSVALIDIRTIYDGWSYGQVDPRALRSFLQYAVKTWSPAPQAVTLVGDGTSDPFDYTKRGALNVNLIPPYLAPVDPWISETACDACYAQLDGVDPLSDTLPDIWLGRLPVKSVAEAQTVVDKIVGYETAPPGGAWRARMVYLADDADAGGDFAAQAEVSIASQPPGMAIARVFYGTHLGQIAIASEARANSLAQLSQGAAVVNYYGHAHQQQWAVTALSEQNNWLLHRSDVPVLTNHAQLPVVLSLTCLSSSFQWPSFLGATIDETLLLSPDGGAVAVWGPTGLGVSWGHDALQRGFYRALWEPTPPARGEERSVPLGELTTAGVTELITTSAYYQETAYTYVLLGDPLTRLRVMPVWGTMLPFVGR